MRSRVFYFIFPFLALMAPIIGNLNSVIDTLLSGASHVQSADHLLVPLAVLSIFCLLIGAFIAGLDVLDTASSTKINFLKQFVIAGVVILAIDLSYGGKEIALSLWPFENAVFLNYGYDIFTEIWQVICFLIGFSVVYTLCWLFRDNLATILISAFGAIFVSTIAIHFFSTGKGPAITYAASHGKANDLSPIIHIVLDEMIGTEGIDRNLPGGEETYQLVRNFHNRFRFRLYGKTFSRHYSTVMSIPNMLNYDYTDKTYGSDSSAHSKYLPAGQFKFFDDLQDRGYDVNVYQSSHVNFCKGENINRCKTLNSFNPASIYISPPKKHTSNSQLPINTMIFSLLIQKASKSYSSYIGHKLIKLISADVYLAPMYDVQSFKLWFDDFTNDIAETKGGEVYFAHFLVPHAPLMLTKDCDTKLKPWESPHLLKEHRNLKAKDFQKARSRHYQDYFEQVTCVFKKLTEFMEKIEKLEPFQNATIIINGDHGSRISSGQYFENLSKQDFVDNYSALFSIRSPVVKPGYDLRSVSIQKLFSETFQDGQKIKKMEEMDTVVVNSVERGRVISAEMPDFGISSLITGG